MTTQPDRIMSAERNLAIYIIECYRGMHVENPPQHPVERSISAIERYREDIRNAALEEAAKLVEEREGPFSCCSIKAEEIRKLKTPSKEQA